MTISRSIEGNDVAAPVNSLDKAETTVEDEVIGCLSEHFDWRYERAAKWVKAYGDICIAWCEFTGGHISREEMDRLLSEKCFLP